LSETLSEGHWKEAQTPPRSSQWIEPVNLFTGVFAVLGFILFGVFAISNLMEAAHGGKGEESKEESRKEEIQRASPAGVQAKPCELAPATTGGGIGPLGSQTW
jgi:hypothetical protein